jgi:hypothetical protein
MINNKLSNFFAEDTLIDKDLSNPKVFYSTKSRTVYGIADTEKQITENNEYIHPEEGEIPDTLSNRDIEEESSLTISLLQGKKSPQFHIILNTENLYDSKFRYNFINRLRLFLQYTKNCVFNHILKKEKPILLEIFSFLEKAIQDSKKHNEKELYDLEDAIACELLTSLRGIVNNPDSKDHNFLIEIESISKITIEILSVNPSLESKIKCAKLAKKIFLMVKNVTYEVDIWKVYNTINRENYFLSQNISSDYAFLFPIIKILSPDDKSLESFINKISTVSSTKVNNLINEYTKLEDLKANINTLRKNINTNTKHMSDLIDEFYHIEKTIYDLKDRYKNLEKNTTSVEKKMLFSKIKNFLVSVCLKSYIEPNILHHIKKLHDKNIQLSDIINANITYFHKLNITATFNQYSSIEYPKLNAPQDKAIKHRHAFIYDSTILYKDILLKTVCDELKITDISQIKNIDIELTDLFHSYQCIVTTIKHSKSFIFIYILRKAMYKTLEHIKDNTYDITKVKLILYAQISINLKNFMHMLASYSINSEDAFNTKFQDLLEVYEIYNQKFIELYN